MTIGTLLQKQTQKVPVFEPELVLTKAVRVMIESEVVESPVVQGNQIVGIVKKRSLVERIVNQRHEDMPVAMYAERDFIFVDLRSKIADLHEIIHQSRQNVIPVIDRGRYMGSLTRESLLLAAIKEKDEIIQQYETYVSGYGVATP